MSNSSPATDRERRLDEVLGKCLQAVDDGDTLPLEELCAAHPDLAGDLRRFFANHARFAEMGSPLREARLGPQRTSWSFLAPPQLPDEIGRLGHYRVLRQLGEGGMGIVFVAEDIQLQRQVALKIMRPELARAEVNRQRFLREARMLAAVQHDHVLAIHHVGEVNQVIFLITPLLTGESLRDRLRRQPRPGIDEIRRISLEIAEGLAAMHAVGLIHRDIKPSNVWLEGANGQVKVIDFGLARSLKTDEQSTGAGAIVGTPSYLSPEQAAGRPIDARSDLFSLGCVLYQMLTGQTPFRGNDLLELFANLANQTPPSPHGLVAECPRMLSDFTMKLLAKQPEDRPASAHEVAACLRAMILHGRDMLEAAASPTPVEEQYEAKPHTSAVSSQSKRGWLGLAAIFCVVGGVAAAFAVIQPWHADEPIVKVKPKTPDIIPAVPKQDDGWQPLWLIDPEKLLWPGQSSKSLVRCEPAEQAIWTVCRGNGLLKLGEVHDPNFTFRVVIDPDDWNATLGVFFGYREGDAGTASFQFLRIWPSQLRGQPKLCFGEYTVEGYSLRLAETPLGTPITKVVALGDELKRPCKIEIAVANDRPVQIRWEDAEVADVIASRTFSNKRVPTYRGGFGLFIEQKTVLSSAAN